MVGVENAAREKLAVNIYEARPEMTFMCIACHGFRGNKDNGGRIVSLAQKINRLKGGLVAFDFSGSGESEGDFARMTLTRQTQDLQAVVDYTARCYELPLVLLGRSFGGSTVLAGGVKDPRIKAFILWSTPIFLEETFATIMPQAYERLKSGQKTVIRDEAGDYLLYPDIAFDLARHDLTKDLQAVGDRPVLIVHAEDDEIVDKNNARYIRENLNNATLHLEKEAGHRFLNKSEVREEVTIAWLKKVLDSGQIVNTI